MSAVKGTSSGMIFAYKISERSIIMKIDLIQTEKKRASRVCKHKRLIFLGKQEFTDRGNFLALFNCEECCTTISLKMKKKAYRLHVKASEPALEKKLVARG